MITKHVLDAVHRTLNAGSLYVNVKLSRPGNFRLEAEFNASPDEHWDLSASAALNNAQLLSSLYSTSYTGVASIVAGAAKVRTCPAFLSSA